MRIAVCGMGSRWTIRAPRVESSHVNKRPVVYNSTGVKQDSNVRTCPIVYGVVRFSAGTAVNPHDPASYLGQTFDASGLREDAARRQVTLHSRAHGDPDLYLIALRSGECGTVDRAGRWHSSGVTVLSFSESGAEQEALLLSEPYNWVRTSCAVYTVERPLSRSQLRTGALREVPL